MATAKINEIITDTTAKINEIITDTTALSEVSEFVDVKKDNTEIREIIVVLKEMMRSKDLNALAAIQLGYNKRVFCLRDNKGYHSFINPMIKKSNNLTFSREKDISLPGREFILPRSDKVVVNFQTPLGEMKAVTLVGASAFVMQRMIDYLNGILLSDIGLEIDEQWDEASEEERVEVLQRYMESLDMVSKQLQEEIAADEELNKQYQAIEFQNALVRGDIQTEQVEVDDTTKREIQEKIDEYIDTEDLESPFEDSKDIK